MPKYTDIGRSKLADMRTLGASGLKRYGGYVREEYLPQLTGLQAARTYRDMSDNDAVCGGIRYAIEMLVRGVAWRVEPSSSRPEDLNAAEFLETCMYDMEQSWIDTISEILSMVWYGFSLHEKVYKRRGGDADEKFLRSKFSDGRIGWRGLPIRSQDTIAEWNFDPSGDIISAIQSAPPTGAPVVLPMAKCILFRTSTYKNSPEGRSLFRSSYRSWYMKKNIEQIEAIGVERDLAGLPVAWVPEEILSPNASQAQKDQLAHIEQIVKNIRQDEQASIIMPLKYDEGGRKTLDLQLMSSSGSRQFDVDKIIQRYDHRIAMSAMADFLLMGQSSSSTGSFAMHSDKTGMFGRSINAHLDIIASGLERPVAELFHLNSFNISQPPRIVHDNIEQIDVAKLGDYVQKLSAAGAPLFPNPELEAYLFEVAGIPRGTNNEPAVSVEQRVELPAGLGSDIEDLHDADSVSSVSLGERPTDSTDAILQSALE